MITYMYHYTCRVLDHFAQRTRSFALRRAKLLLRTFENEEVAVDHRVCNKLPLDVRSASSARHVSHSRLSLTASLEHPIRKKGTKISTKRAATTCASYGDNSRACCERFTMSHLYGFSEPINRLSLMFLGFSILLFVYLSYCDYCLKQNWSPVNNVLNYTSN